MRTKRKMILAISAFAMLILASVVGVVAVLAAQNVTVNSKVKITYSSIEFEGTVDASYTVLNNTSVSFNQVTFDGGEAENTNKEVDTTGKDTITLTKDNNKVTFTFVFKTGETGYKARLDSFGTLTAGCFASPVYTGITGLNAPVSIPAGKDAGDGLTATITFELIKFNQDISSLDLDFKWTISNKI